MKLAVDLGGTKVRIAAADGEAFPLISRFSYPSSGLTTDALVALLQGRLAEWGLDPGALSGIGISVAAIVNEGGRVIRAENLGWRDVPLQGLLEEAFRCPVAVETDVFCGALFEATSGHAKSAASALYVCVGTGVGHALIVEGKVWRGAHGSANAFGHLVMFPDGEPCYCGNRGCLCLVASGSAQDGKEASPVPVEMLARGLGIATTLFDPEMIILGGGALNQPWFDLERLGDRLPDFIYPGLAMPHVLRSSVPDPNLRGAALLPMERK